MSSKLYNTLHFLTPDEKMWVFYTYFLPYFFPLPLLDHFSTCIGKRSSLFTPVLPFVLRPQQAMIPQMKLLKHDTRTYTGKTEYPQ